MKFGCCLNMIAKDKDKTGVGYINKLSELGYDYAELPLAEIMALKDSEFQSLKDRVHQSGISCDVCNNFFSEDIRLTGDSVNADKIMKYVEKAIDRAHVLGAQYIVFGSGKAKHIPIGYSKKRGYHQIVRLLTDIAPIALKKGITIVIEPLRKVECNIINTFKEGCMLAEDVNCSNIKVLVDFYHLSVEKEPVKNIFELGKEFLQHVHFANPNGRIYPDSENEYDYRPFIDALKVIGYSQRVSCEAYTSNFDNQAATALQFFERNFNF